MGGYLDQAIERLKQFEGSVPWMYLDTVGKVTVGVGTMLPDARSAGTLPFRMGDRAATVEEIAKEFARVSALVKGRAAASYRTANGLRLAEGAIDGRLRDVLEGFEGYLRAHIGGYGEMPDGVKLALLDMVYNLGPGRLFHQYPRLVAAIERGDWAEAAGACLRRGPSAARNAWTREQFQEAARRRPRYGRSRGDGSPCCWERVRGCWRSGQPRAGRSGGLVVARGAGEATCATGRCLRGWGCCPTVQAFAPNWRSDVWLSSGRRSGFLGDKVGCEQGIKRGFKGNGA